MKITDKKECPKCHNKNIFDTGSGIGSDGKKKGSYTFIPRSGIIYECIKCQERFLYKK